MNFFEAQDQARKATRWLVIVYALATALIVIGVTLIVGVALFSTSIDGYRLSFGQMLAANPVPLAITALVTALFIVGASIYKTSILSSGGGQVARELGGTLVPADARDPLRRRLRNVVEEMAIASGVPVPEIYVLEEEGAINAFAAGYTPGDAAVAVTRGTLELLDRDELQGVIAHEFSHVLNGDMRLNIRMMGVLHGILILARACSTGRRRPVFRAPHQGRRIPAARVSGGCIGRSVHAKSRRDRECSQEDWGICRSVVPDGCRSGRSQPHAVRRRPQVRRAVCNAPPSRRTHPGNRPELHGG
jgi:hypothetical protein